MNGIPANLAQITDFAAELSTQTIRVSTPTIDKLRALLEEREWTHGSKTRFDSGPINISLSGRENDPRIEIRLYGKFTFGDDTDQSAYVHIDFTWMGNDHPWYRRAFVTANRWQGNSLKPMPDGARKNIAEAVLVEANLLTDDELATLKVEVKQRNTVATIAQCVSEATRSLEQAKSLLAASGGHLSA